MQETKQEAELFDVIDRALREAFESRAYAAEHGDAEERGTHHTAALAFNFAIPQFTAWRKARADFTFSDAVKHFAAPKDHWVYTARKNGERDGELEIDSPTVVSEGDEAGAYVMSWLWVEMPDVVEAEWRVGLLGEAFTPEEVEHMKTHGWASAADVSQAEQEGWFMHLAGDSYDFCRVSEDVVFPGDVLANEHVCLRAMEGSEFHRRALKAYKALNPEGYTYLLEVCSEG